jgi:hypothetical protein
MPERLQYTVNQGGIIEVALSINGKALSLHIRPEGVPWNSDAFQEPSVRAALFRYMTGDGAEEWIGWPEQSVSSMLCGLTLTR